MGRKSREKQSRRVLKEKERLDQQQAAGRQVESAILGCDCGRVWRNMSAGIWSPVTEGHNPDCTHRILHRGRALFTV